jgi:hypothetical protein
MNSTTREANPHTHRFTEKVEAHSQSDIYQYRYLHQLSTMEATKKTGPQERMPLAPTPFLEEERAQDLLPRLLDYVKENKWTKVVQYLEQDPSLSRREVSMVCQGENLKCLLIHLLSGNQSTPISVIDSLVTLNPGSLLQPEQRGGRLPIHLAVVKGASHAVVQQLCNARPQALQVADEEGNHAVHYAAMYGSSSMLRLIVQAYPEACRVLNQRDRYLHGLQIQGACLNHLLGYAQTVPREVEVGIRQLFFPCQIYQFPKLVAHARETVL